MAVRPWSVPYAESIQVRSSQRLSNYQSLAVSRNREVRVVFMSQIVQPLKTPITFFSVEMDGTKRDTEKKPPWRVRASFDVTRPTRKTARPRGPPAVQAPETCQNSKPSLHLW